MKTPESESSPSYTATCAVNGGSWTSTTAGERDFLRHGFRLLSAYTLSDGTKIWVITEADRSAPTLLLPEEY